MGSASYTIPLLRSAHSAHSAAPLQVPEYAHSTKGSGGVLLLFHADADVNCLLLWDDMAGKVGEQEMLEQAEQNWQKFRKIAGSVPIEDVSDGKAGG